MRKGIEDYDRRKGWRGPITNKIKNKNWENTVSKYKLDPTLNWRVAEITSLSNDEIKFKTIDKKNNINGNISFKNVKWSIPNKKSIEKYIMLVILFLLKKK